MTRGLTPKQQRFVEEYLIDLNATAAAKRAGYSARTAEWQGPQLLGKPHVAQAVMAAREALAERTAVTQDRIASELARLGFFDIRCLVNDDGTPKRLHELDDDSARAISSIDVVSVGNADVGVGQVLKFKMADKGANLERLAKLLGYFERDNRQKNPLGAFDAARFFAVLFSRPGEA